MADDSLNLTQGRWGAVRAWWASRRGYWRQGFLRLGWRAAACSVVDHLPIMVVRVRFSDGGGRITYVSANALSLFGMPGDRLVEAGANLLLECIHPGDRILVSRALRDVGAGQRVDLRARILRPDGLDSWVKIQGVPIAGGKSGTPARDGHGQFHFTDITPEMDENRALRERLRWIKDLLDAVPIGIASVDPWQRTYVNPAFATLFDLRHPEDSTPEDWWRVIHPEDAVAMRSRWELNAPTGAKDETEFRVRQADGSYRWVLGKAVPRMNSRGELVGIISSVADIQDLTQIRRALGEASRRMRVLVDHLPVTIYRKRLTRTERSYLSLSGEFKAQFGLVGARYRYMSEAGMLRVMRSQDMRPIEQCWKELVSRGESIHRMPLRRANGDERWFEFRERLIKRDEDVLEVKGLVLDVTEDEIQKRQLQAARKRYQDLVELLPVGVFEDPLSGGDVFVNDQWAKICGLPPEGLRGAPWTDLIHPDDRERVITSWNRATASREQFTAEFRLMRPEGGTSWLLLHAVPIFGPYGQFQSYIGTATDVTRIKDLEQELRDTVTHLQATIGNLPGVVFRAYHSPAAFRLLYVSEGAEKVIGLTAQQAMALGGPQQFALLHPEELEPDFDIALDLRQTGQSWSRESIIRPDGSQYWADIRCSLIETTDDGLIYEGLILDVTAEVQAKLELERQEHERQKLERQMFEAMKLDSLGRLAGGIAHDFNNLLGAIMGFSQFITEDSARDHPAYQHAERILAAADRGKGLVEQILAFARQSDTERRLFSLDALLKETEVLLQVAIPKAIHLTVETGDSDLKILADRGQLGQVLMNLCMNARDSLASGAGTISVSVCEMTPDCPAFNRLISRRFEPAMAMEVDEDPIGTVRGTVGTVAFDQPLLLLTVRDTGIGMDGAVMRQAFDPFFTTKPLGKGTGLGLSVVHGIVLGHQGAILVESRPGIGTEVQVVLPAVLGAPSILETPEVEVKADSHGRVLVVDDDRDFGDMVSLMLKRQGWVVSYFDNPLAAHAAFLDRPDHWSLLITDQAMPGLRGQDLIRKIKSVAPDLPCVLCSGYDEALDEDSANRIGASAWIRKPATAKQFLAVVSKVMQMDGNQGG